MRWEDYLACMGLEFQDMKMIDNSYLTSALSGQAPILANLSFYSYSFICKQFQHVGACSLRAGSLACFVNRSNKVHLFIPYLFFLSYTVVTNEYTTNAMNASTKELKSLLHESIENIDDASFLQTIKKILDRKYEPKEEITLSPYQLKRIDEAQKSLNQGDYLTNEQADQLVTQWLNE